MAELVLTDVDEVVLHDLEERGSRHGRSPAEEAKAILAEALRGKRLADWEPIDSIYNRLAATGQKFSNSADLLREDRER